MYIHLKDERTLYDEKMHPGELFSQVHFVLLFVVNRYAAGCSLLIFCCSSNNCRVA